MHAVLYENCSVVFPFYMQLGSKIVVSPHSTKMLVFSTCRLHLNIRNVSQPIRMLATGYAVYSKFFLAAGAKYVDKYCSIRIRLS